MVTRVLAVERLSVDELSALAAYEQGRALNEIFAELTALGREAIEARKRLGRARHALALVDREDPSARDLRKAEVIDAQTALDVIRERARTMRELKSILQTLVRAIP